MEAGVSGLEEKVVVCCTLAVAKCGQAESAWLLHGSGRHQEFSSPASAMFSLEGGWWRVNRANGVGEFGDSERGEDPGGRERALQVSSLSGTLLCWYREGREKWH